MCIISKMKKKSKKIFRIVSYIIYLFLIFKILILYSGTSLWKRIRKIIIGIKYSQENIRLLKSQIQALNIKEAKIPQLGKL
jgi:competence protein ComGC